MHDLVEAIPYKGHTINIFYADDPWNPRTDYDNADVMFFQHSRYTLGDKDAEDPFEDVSMVEVDDQWLTQEQADLVRQEFEDWVPDTDEECAQRDVVLLTVDERDGEWETRRRLRSDIAICLPVMMYDHSGITIWHGNSNPAQDAQGWDSGLIGFHYVTKDAVEKEWGGDLDRAKAYMEATIKTYDSYLRGDAYGYVIDEDGDSCWGFIGDYEDEKSGLLEYARNAIDCLIEEERKEVEEVAAAEALEKDTVMMECD